MIAVVAGHPSVDRLYEVEALKQGEIHRLPFNHIHVLPGGKGLNAARAIQSLGGSAHVFAILAGHAGRWIESALSSERIAGTFVWTKGETRTSISVATTAKPGVPSTDFYETSQPIEPGVWAELESAVSRSIKGAQMVCLSGSLIPGAPTEAYRRMTEIAHAAGIPVAIDSHGPQLEQALKAGPELIKINAHEAAEALGTAAPSENPLPWALDAALEIRRRAGGNGRCAITCGADGIALADQAGATCCGRLDQLGNYPVGSGDATLAAFSLAYVTDLPSRETLALALGAGAANAEVPGTGVLSRDRAHELARRAQIEA